MSFSTSFQSKAKFFSIFFLIILLVRGCFALPGVQKEVGSWMSGLDPKRAAHIEEDLRSKSSKQLIRLLNHGDDIVSSTAKALLFQRNEKEYLPAYAKMLKNGAFRQRAIARLLLTMDDQNVDKILIEDIKRYPVESADYRQIIAVLSKRKYAPILPYVVKYSEQSPWWSGAPNYFVELGSVDGLPALYKLRERIPENAMSEGRKYEVNRILESITTLESIKKQQ